ncbi:MAG: phosphoribosyl-AMP cyclohydrolase [Hyphomicrobiaceae bacterium]
MTSSAGKPPADRGSKAEIEEGSSFRPRFDGDGLIPAIVTEDGGDTVLMFAFMNEEALALTLATGLAHFWTRSRQRIWKKGEDSGNFLRVLEVRTDCDQDVLWLRARVEGNGVACHTGRASCFYRRVARGADGAVTLVPAED